MSTHFLAPSSVELCFFFCFFEHIILCEHPEFLVREKKNKIKEPTFTIDSKQFAINGVSFVFVCNVYMYLYI